MTAEHHTRPAFEIAPPGRLQPLPGGWVVDEIRWNGEDMEIAYDAHRSRVMRAGGGTFDQQKRQTLASAGWELAGTDGDGAELWIADRAQVAMARLRRLAAEPAPPDAAGLTVD